MTKCKSNSTLINSNGNGLSENLFNPIVTRQELERFKEIARTDYGADLTDEQALEQATALVMFFETAIKSSLETKKRTNNNE